MGDVVGAVGTSVLTSVLTSVFTSDLNPTEDEAMGSSFLMAKFSTVVIFEASEFDSTLGSDTLKSTPLQDSVPVFDSSLTVLAGTGPSPSTSGTLRLVGAPRSRG
jgi:hypothetical protein